MVERVIKIILQGKKLGALLPTPPSQTFDNTSHINIVLSISVGNHSNTPIMEKRIFK